MFEVPSRPDVYKCVITAETVKQQESPLLLTRTPALESGMDDSSSFPA